MTTVVEQGGAADREYTHPDHPGVTVREYDQVDGSILRTFSIRHREPDGSRPRRTLDTLEDALDLQAKRRSDKRWRPEELARERRGSVLFGDFFAWWWTEIALIELDTKTLEPYRYLWHAHAETPLANVPIREIGVRRVLKFRNDLIRAGVGTSSPKDLTVVGGDGWRSANDFAIKWTNTPSPVGAPVVGASWELCPTPVGDAKCTRGSAGGKDINSIDHLKLPAPGAYTLKLWLRDEAGNEDARLSANPVTLRYDDASPSLAFLPPDPNDPTLVAVQTSDLGSGVGSGQIQMRRQGSTGNWLTLPTVVRGGQLQAHIDDERLGDGVFDLQATAVDVAGNQRSTGARTDGSARRSRFLCG